MGKIIIWLVVTLLLVGLLIYGLGGKINLSFDLSLNTYKFSDNADYSAASSFSLESISALDVDWVNGNVKLISYDGNTIEVSEETQGETDDALVMRYSVSAGKLSIKYAASGTRLPFSFEKQLTIKLPSSMELSRVSVESASANVSLDGICATDVELDSTSGKIDIKDCKIATLEADTTSGAISHTGEIGNVEFDTTSGSITIFESNDNGNAGEISCESTSGAINVTLNSSTNVRLSTKTTSGRIDITLAAPTGGKINAESTSGNCTVSANDFPDGFTLTRSSVSGSLKNDFPVRSEDKKSIYGDGRLEIDISTVSGSVNIIKTQ